MNLIQLNLAANVKEGGEPKGHKCLINCFALKQKCQTTEAAAATTTNIKLYYTLITKWKGVKCTPTKGAVPQNNKNKNNRG